MAIGLDPPHPLDLLEDDGITDIHGSIATYSYAGPVSAIPKPSPAVLLGGVLAALAAASRIQRNGTKSKREKTISRKCCLPRC